MKGLNNLEKLRNKKAFICDMDGVIYHGNRLLPGVKDFVEWLKTNGKQFLFLINALYEAGYSMNDINPDYVVVGETRSYSFEKLEKAINMVMDGAKRVGTNPDLTDPVEKGLAPATGALIAPIELAAGRKAYFVGNPNVLCRMRVQSGED